MYYFIINEHGGGGRARRTWEKVESLLHRRNVPYRSFSTRYEGHGAQLARDISRLPDGDKRLVVVGGDGTINEVLNGIEDFDAVRFAVIPTGSGNDFVRGMRVPRNTAAALSSILDSSGCRDVDVALVRAGAVERRVFGISCGLGLDAIVCKEAQVSRVKRFLNKVGLGGLTYIILTVWTLFRMETESVTAHFDDGTVHTFNRLIFLACMNFPAEGGGVPMCPRASAEDGELSICAVDGIPKWRTFLLLPLLVAGRHEGRGGFFLRNCKSVDLITRRSVVLHTDGEYAGDVRSVHVECLKGRLHYMV